MAIQIVSYRCILKNPMGHIISSSIVRDVVLDPNSPNTQLRGLTLGLKGIQSGEVRQIFLQAKDAYGFYDPNLTLTRPLEETELSSPFKLDEQVLVIRDGLKIPMRVVDLSRDTVTLDGNHPLAGQDLLFEVHALETRDATPDELQDSHLGQPLLH